MKEQIDLNSQSSQLTFKRLVQIVKQKKMESLNNKQIQFENGSEIQSKIMYDLALAFQTINQTRQQLQKFYMLQKEINDIYFSLQTKNVARLIQLAQGACDKQPRRLGLTPEEEQRLKEKQMLAFIEAYLSQYNSQKHKKSQLKTKSFMQLTDLIVSQSFRVLSAYSKRDKKACQLLRKCRLWYLKLSLDLVNQVNMTQKYQKSQIFIQEIIERVKNPEKIKNHPVQVMKIYSSFEIEENLSFSKKNLVESCNENIRSVNHVAYDLNNPLEKQQYKKASYWQQHQASTYSKMTKSENYQKKIQKIINNWVQNDNDILNQLIQKQNQQEENQDKLNSFFYSYQIKIQQIKFQLNQLRRKKILLSKGLQQNLVENVLIVDKVNSIALNELISYIAKEREDQYIRVNKKRNEKKKLQGKKLKQIIHQDRTVNQSKVMYEIAQTIQIVNMVSQQIKKFGELQKEVNITDFSQQTENMTLLIQSAEKDFEIQPRRLGLTLEEEQKLRGKQMLAFIEQYLSQQNPKQRKQITFPPRRNFLKTLKCFTAFRKLVQQDRTLLNFLVFIKKQYSQILLQQCGQYMKLPQKVLKKQAKVLINTITSKLKINSRSQQTLSQLVQNRICQLKPEKSIDIMKVFKKLQKKQSQNFEKLKQLARVLLKKKNYNALEHLIDLQFTQGELRKLLELRYQNQNFPHYFKMYINGLQNFLLEKLKMVV